MPPKALSSAFVSFHAPSSSALGAAGFIPVVLCGLAVGLVLGLVLAPALGLAPGLVLGMAVGVALGLGLASGLALGLTIGLALAPDSWPALAEGS